MGVARPPFSGRLTRLVERNFAQGIAAIDQQPATGHESRANGSAGPLPSPGVPTVEGTDADRHGQIERRLTVCEGEELGARLAEPQQPGGNLGSRVDRSLRDGRRRPIDRQHKAARPDLTGHFPGHGAGPATDLEHTKSGPQRQSIDDLP